MSRLAGRRSSPSAGPLLVALVALAACGPRLHVESARLTPLATGGAAPARLELVATYAGMTIDPRRAVRLHIAGDVQWVTLRPVPGAAGVFAVDGSEHGYGIRLDTTAKRIEVTEPVWPPRDDGPVDIAVGQMERRACTRLWVVPAEGGWTYAGRQESCR